MPTEDEIWNAALDAAIAMANQLGGDRPRFTPRLGNDAEARYEQMIRGQHVRARSIAHAIGLLKRPAPPQLDTRPDGSGLDDGPFLPGRAPRKRPPAKSRAELAAIRARAWETRRARCGQPGPDRRGHGGDHRGPTSPSAPSAAAASLPLLPPAPPDSKGPAPMTPLPHPPRSKAQIEADVLAQLAPAPLPQRLARTVALSGTALASGLAVHPQWISQEVRS